MKKALIEYLKLKAIKVLAGASGFQALIARYALNLVIKLVIRAHKHLEVSKEVKENLDKYKKVIDDPNSTADDIRNAAPDFLK